jgi:hypothetical protein
MPSLFFRPALLATVSPPALSLVFCTIQHARKSYVCIVLVVPDWKGQPWWPKGSGLLVRDSETKWADMIMRCRRLPGGERTLQPGRQPGSSFFGQGFPDCDLFVFKIDFSMGKQNLPSLESLSACRCP